MGDIGTAVDAALAKKRRDIGIDVKRAVRHGALDAGDGADTCDNVVAQADVFGAHLCDALLRAAQRGDGGLLHDGRRVRCGLTLQLGSSGDDCCRAERVSQAPAGHGVSFRERTDHQESLAILVELTDGKIPASVVEIDVALIGDDPDAALVGEADDGGHIFGTHHGAGRVRRRVKNDELGLGRDEARDHVGGDTKTLRLVGMEQHAGSASVVHYVFERDPVRDGQNDLVAVVHQDGDRVEQRMFAANRGIDFVAFVGGAEIGGMTAEDCIL